MAHIRGHRLDSITRILEHDRFAASTMLASEDGPVLPLVAAIRSRASLQTIELLLWHGASVTAEVVAAMASTGPISMPMPDEENPIFELCTLIRQASEEFQPNAEWPIDFSSAACRARALTFDNQQLEAWEQLQQGYRAIFQDAMVDRKSYACLSVLLTPSTIASTRAAAGVPQREEKLALMSLPYYVQELVRAYVRPCLFDRMERT